MDLGKVMDELGDAVNAIPSLKGRVFRYPTESFKTPAAIVAYPDDYTFDGAYARGHDRMKISVWVVVGKASDRASRTNLAAYCAGSGTKSIKTAIETHTYTQADVAHVTGIEFDPFLSGDVIHISAEFSVDVVGPGT